jgi:hypothetical protein
LLPEVTAVIVGEPGNALGIPDEDVDAAPEPEADTPRSNTEYVVPFVKPEIVSGDVALAAEIHFVPLSNEYS